MNETNAPILETLQAQLQALAEDVRYLRDCEAIRQAMGGRPGPVLISLPEDLLDEEAPADARVDGARPGAVRPGDEDIRAVIELLASARRPVILAGGGILRARTSTELLRFADLLQVPIVASWRRADVVSSFSSSGPTPRSLRMKPDVAAPGSNILSSIPASEGTWTRFSGTSMAAPHVSGGAALLRARNPSWTVQQVRSALVLTGQPAVWNGTEAPPTRVGGGRIDLARAATPLVFASPSSVSSRTARLRSRTRQT